MFPVTTAPPPSTSPLIDADADGEGVLAHPPAGDDGTDRDPPIPTPLSLIPPWKDRPRIGVRCRSAATLVCIIFAFALVTRGVLGARGKPMPTRGVPGAGG